MPAGPLCSITQRLTQSCSWGGGGGGRRQELLCLLTLFSLLVVCAVASYLRLGSLSEREVLEYKQLARVCHNKTVPTGNDDDDGGDQEEAAAAAAVAGTVAAATAAGRRGRRWVRILHQTWKDEQVPERYRRMQASCRRLNPEYVYMFWTDADLERLIRQHYPWFLHTYRSYPYPIERIDAARLFLLHRHGGVYLDMDIECKVPLRRMREQALAVRAADSFVEVILAETDPLGITNNMLMAAQPGHPFFEYATRRLLATSGRYLTPHWTVMFSAGPLFLYRTYLRYPCKHHVHLISAHDHGHVYFRHAQARTWHHWDGPFITWFDYHGRTLLKVAAVLLVVIVGLVAARCLLRRPISKFTQTHHRWRSNGSDTWRVTYDYS